MIEYLGWCYCAIRNVMTPIRADAKVRERGATAVEYALMVTLIAVVIVGAVTAFGINVGALFSKAATRV